MYAEEAVIYSDILFLVNFSLDYLALFIAGRVLNCGGRVLRLCSAAVLGGLYAFIPYLIELPTLAFVPIHLGFAFFMVFVAFGKRETKKLFLLWGMFIVSCALLGGLITAAYSLLSQYSGNAYSWVSPISFAVICLASALLALLYGLLCRNKINTNTARIKLTAKGKSFGAHLLTDSGNLVTEPFSALPVIIISASALPPPFDTPESEGFPLPIRLIPFTTTAGSNCFFGFRPEKIEIIGLAKKPKTVDAYIGIDTQNQSYSGYDGLIPASLL